MLFQVGPAAEAPHLLGRRDLGMSRGWVASGVGTSLLPCAGGFPQTRAGSCRAQIRCAPGQFGCRPRAVLRPLSIAVSVTTRLPRGPRSTRPPRPRSAGAGSRSTSPVREALTVAHLNHARPRLDAFGRLDLDGEPVAQRLGREGSFPKHIPKQRRDEDSEQPIAPGSQSHCPPVRFFGIAHMRYFLPLRK